MYKLKSPNIITLRVHNSQWCYKHIKSCLQKSLSVVQMYHWKQEFLNIFTLEEFSKRSDFQPNMPFTCVQKDKRLCFKKSLLRCGQGCKFMCAHISVMCLRSRQIMHIGMNMQTHADSRTIDLLLAGSSLSRWMLAGRRCFVVRVCKAQLQLGRADRRDWHRPMPFTTESWENNLKLSYSHEAVLVQNHLHMNNAKTKTVNDIANLVFVIKFEKKSTDDTDLWGCWECVTSVSWREQPCSAVSLCCQVCTCFSLSVFAEFFVIDYRF